MKRIKILVLSLVVALSATVAIGGLASADTSQLQGDACKGLAQLGQGCDAQGESPIKNLIATIVTILSWVVGVAAIIVIVIAGLKFITSGGDSNAVASAKNSLIYALVGLVVAAVAQFLVHFALHQATTAQSGSSGTSSSSSQQATTGGSLSTP